MDDDFIALTDFDNVRLFSEEHQEDIRFCPEIKKWLSWNGLIWEIDDSETKIFQKGIKTIKKMREKALTIQDADLKKEALNHAKKSETLSRVKVMLNLAQRTPLLQFM